MIEALCLIKANKKKNTVKVKGRAESDDQWLSMAAAMVSSVLENCAENERKKYFAAIIYAVKEMVFGKEKEVTPDDVQGETRAPEETEGDPEA